jgi:predicted nucleotidyltransferase
MKISMLQLVHRACRNLCETAMNSLKKLLYLIVIYLVALDVNITHQFPPFRFLNLVCKYLVGIFISEID